MGIHILRFIIFYILQLILNIFAISSCVIPLSSRASLIPMNFLFDMNDRLLSILLDKVMNHS